MSSTEVVVTVFVAIISGSFLSEVRAIVKARREKSRMIAAAPDEHLDSSMQRSQSALLVQEGTITALQKRAEDAEARELRLQQRVDTVERQLDEARALHRRELDELRAEHDRKIADLHTELDTMRGQLAEAYRDRPNYRPDPPTGETS